MRAIGRRNIIGLVIGPWLASAAGAAAAPAAPARQDTPSAPVAAPVRQDIPPEPWIKRHRPRRNVGELGVGIGALLPAADHELYDYTKTWQPYRAAAANLAVRGGFYPLSFLGLEAEAAVAPTRTAAGGRAALFGVRGQAVLQLPLASVAPFVLVGGGLLGSGGALGRDVDGSLHFGGGLKVYFNRWLGVRVDARAHVGTAHTVPAYRTFYPEVLAGLVVTLGRPYGDGDGDGVPDPGQRARVEDACPRQPGVRALRGCPDFDADGLRDADDRCPAQRGTADRDGCPALLDSDADGYYDPGQYKVSADRIDRCPTVAGKPAYGGCQAPDSDADILKDDVDRCPQQAETVNGFEDDDGCPDELPIDVKRLLGTIEGVQFAWGSARLSESSKPALKNTATILAEYPGIKLEIQGHTDALGDPEENKRLSEQRAESIRRELIAQGVAEDRLTAVGYGSERLIDTSGTPAGNARNRRIEFRLLDAAGQPLTVPGESGTKP